MYLQQCIAHTKYHVCVSATIIFIIYNQIRLVHIVSKLMALPS